MEGQEGRVAARQKSAEMVVAGLFFALGALVIFDSAVGSTWAKRRPKSLLSFHVGLIMCASSAINPLRAAFRAPTRTRWHEVGQLWCRSCPAAVYVLVIT
jgi:hypothetical protein